MDRKVVSAIIAVGIWLAVVQVFCALWVRDGIRDAAVSDVDISGIREEVRAIHSVVTELEKIEANTDSIDGRLAPPAEQMRRAMRKLQEMQPPKP